MWLFPYLKQTSEETLVKTSASRHEPMCMQGLFSLKLNHRIFQISFLIKNVPICGIGCCSVHTVCDFFHNAVKQELQFSCMKKILIDMTYFYHPCFCISNSFTFELHSLSLQDVHDCYLDLFQTHLHFVSNNTTGLTYQVRDFLQVYSSSVSANLRVDLKIYLIFL